METRNCPRCGKIFAYVKDPICPECMKEEEELFESVRTYLKENPRATIAKVTRETGVSAKKINKYLREGRLEITEGLNDFLTCLKCGKPILTGKYCRECSEKLSKKFTEQSSKSEEKDGPKMRHFR